MQAEREEARERTSRLEEELGRAHAEARRLQAQIAEFTQVVRVFVRVQACILCVCTQSQNSASACNQGEHSWMSACDAVTGSLPQDMESERAALLLAAADARSAAAEAAAVAGHGLGIEEGAPPAAEVDLRGESVTSTVNVLIS